MTIFPCFYRGKRAVVHGVSSPNVALFRGKVMDGVDDAGVFVVGTTRPAYRKALDCLLFAGISDCVGVSTA